MPFDGGRSFEQAALRAGRMTIQSIVEPSIFAHSTFRHSEFCILNSEFERSEHVHL
jgi:hypothetical protein